MDAEQQTPPKSASLENRAANALNAVMIMLLSAAAATLVTWMSFLHLQRELARGLDFSWSGILMASGQALSTFLMLMVAYRGMRFGYRMLFKTSATG